MAELAGAYPDRVVSVKEIAERQEISAKYLEQIMNSLKLAGLVKSRRGVHGGYMLARPPEQIELREVFEALEGSPAPVDCVDDPELCPLKQTCPTRQTWVELKKSIVQVLEETTVADLGRRNEPESCDASPMYHI
jgi:Rrf2 family protein